MYNMSSILLVKDIFNNMDNRKVTEKEVIEILDGSNTVTGRNIKEVMSVRNLYNAVVFLNQSAKSDCEITKAFIFKLHDILMDGITKTQGVFRNMNEKRYGCGVYDCRRVEEQLNQFLESFDKRRVKYSDSVYIVYLAAYVHLEIIRIRPFNDGNCRLATLLMNYILIKNGYNAVSITEDIRDTYQCFTRLYSGRKVIQPMVDLIRLGLKNGGFDINA